MGGVRPGGMVVHFRRRRGRNARSVTHLFEQSVTVTDGDVQTSNRAKLFRLVIQYRYDLVMHVFILSVAYDFGQRDFEVFHGHHQVAVPGKLVAYLPPPPTVCVLVCRL